MHAAYTVILNVLSSCFVCSVCIDKAILAFLRLVSAETAFLLNGWSSVSKSKTSIKRMFSAESQVISRWLGMMEQLKHIHFK